MFWITVVLKSSQTTNICTLTGLKFLVRMCSDMGLPEAANYAMQLKKAEKAKELRERIGSSQSGTGMSDDFSW